MIEELTRIYVKLSLLELVKKINSVFTYLRILTVVSSEKNCQDVLGGGEKCSLCSLRGVKSP